MSSLVVEVCSPFKPPKLKSGTTVTWPTLHDTILKARPFPLSTSFLRLFLCFGCGIQSLIELNKTNGSDYEKHCLYRSLLIHFADNAIFSIGAGSCKCGKKYLNLEVKEGRSLIFRRIIIIIFMVCVPAVYSYAQP